MKKESMQRRDDGATFYAEDSTTGYWVLFVVVIFVGAGLIWWWPGARSDLWSPWERQIWSHPEALAYAVLIAVVGACIVVIGGYLSDRRRRHTIDFDRARRVVDVEEWWRGVRVSMQFPFAIFSSFEVHQPAGRGDQYESGVTLRNGSYWRLERHRKAEDLQEVTAELNAEMDFDKSDDCEEVADVVGIPERLEIDKSERQFMVSWLAWERPATRICIAVAAALFAAASLLPAVLVFDGAHGWLWTAIVAGAVLLGVPLFLEDRSRKAWPFLVGWLALAVAAVFALGANWFYFPLATLGTAIFAKSAIDLIIGLKWPEEHRIRIDGVGDIYENGRPLKSGGEVVRAQELEGAIVNITEIRPAKMLLVGPSGREENRRRHLGLDGSDNDESMEPVELKSEGLSLFELIGLSLILDRELQRWSDEAE